MTGISRPQLHLESPPPPSTADPSQPAAPPSPDLYRARNREPQFEHPVDKFTPPHRFARGTKREYSLPSLHASILTPGVHAVPARYHVTVEEVEDEYDAARSGGAGVPGSQSNPFRMDSDDEMDLSEDAGPARAPPFL